MRFGVVGAIALCVGTSSAAAVQSHSIQFGELARSKTSIVLVQSSCGLKDKSKCPMEPVQVERSRKTKTACGLDDKSDCPMMPVTVKLTSDGKILAPSGKTILRSSKPIMLKAADGKELLLVGPQVSSCCNLSDKSCCQVIIDPQVVSITGSGDLIAPGGRTIFKAGSAYAIKGPRGELVYEYYKAGQ